MKTMENITDDDIRNLRDSHYAIHDPEIAKYCTIALRSGESIGKGSLCHRCNWRKGGVDSWDGAACKCGLRSVLMCRCDRCSGLGSVPYNIGSEACPSCDGSGSFDPTETQRARNYCASVMNDPAFIHGW